MGKRAYQPPDFSAPALKGAPDATFAPMPADGVLPDGFFATTNLPTYVRLGGRWLRPAEPRMDGVIVLGDDGSLVVREPRRLRKGAKVATGEAEDGSRGIYVDAAGFMGSGHSGNEFRFMSAPVSRERPVDYDHLARLLAEERARSGYVVWVVGPALVHARARADLAWFIERGYVQALLGGNALGVHDLEAALFGTALGVTDSGDAADHGHGLHLRAINVVRQAGSIEAVVKSGRVKAGVMHALITKQVPYVLAGSIRDDGPLPGVISDAAAAQDAMRVHTIRATCAVMVASALHAIAVGNMLPAFVDEGAKGVRPLPTICVDQTEFVVSKLKDRGTHQAYGVVTNAQDFMAVLRLHLERAESGTGKS
jgi:lysine-ketoglutarate reductase/saccharopine dehydrogenase-like protein (TIGR00300 family)